MIQSLFYFVLALLGLGFLVFIHELGHYFMARRVGMRIEAFGIGFGKPIYSWEHKGVKWNLCWLPFGGYVRIAGMEKKGNVEPSQIPDGFFGKGPWARIQVALMGPLVNILFTLLAFTLIWMSGGRDKPFAEVTHTIGWVDPTSPLKSLDIKPGDEIISLDGRPYHGIMDLAYALALDGQGLRLQGYHVDYATGKKEPFSQILTAEEKAQNLPLLSPASYLVFSNSSLRSGSPMQGSGIQPNDRIIWADGEILYSATQLSRVINSGRVYLTVQRGNQFLQIPVPRMKISDLNLDSSQREELDDWQHDANLKAKVGQLYFIPYNISTNGTVENGLSYLDANSEEHAPLDLLQVGDKIVAVDGFLIDSATQFLSRLQTHYVQLIVARGETAGKISSKDADQNFINSTYFQDLEKISHAIGTSNPVTHSGNLVLLKPVKPAPTQEIPLTAKETSELQRFFEESRKQIGEIEDSQVREYELKRLEENQNRLMLGITFHDRSVIYNPTPFALFGDVFDQIARTLKGLVTGVVSPKNMAGPVGIVQIIHHGWSDGFKEALFWMGLISLNLAILNLLPLPVLDGGHILFALIEKVTGRPIKAKTMEWLIIPFAVLLIIAAIYFTFQDLSRILSRFF